MILVVNDCEYHKNDDVQIMMTKTEILVLIVKNSNKVEKVENVLVDRGGEAQHSKARRDPHQGGCCQNFRFYKFVAEFLEIHQFWTVQTSLIIIVIIIVLKF